jgi:hypothetical protein
MTILSEICDRADQDKGKLESSDAQVGEVYLNEMEKQLNELGRCTELVQKASIIKRRFHALKKDKENVGRPVSIVCEEPVMSIILNEEPTGELPPPKTEFDLKFDPSMPHTPIKNAAVKSGGQKKLESSVESVKQWERQETDKGIPYYINHATETTTWNHPRLTDVVTSLKSMNQIKFSAYRTAMKLRKLQKTLALDYFKIDHMHKAFR